MTQPDRICEGYTGGMQETGNEVIGIPTITAIYWDQAFVQLPGLGPMMDRFFERLISGSYFNGLTQYNVTAPEFAGSFIMDPSPKNNTPQATPLDDTNIQSQLKQWFSKNAIPGPNQQDYDSLYVVITPAGLEVTFEGKSSLTDFGGYHSATGMGLFGWGKASLFYCVIPGSPGQTTATVAQDQLPFWFDLMTASITHEVVEASTNRTGNGWHANVSNQLGNNSNCEACDVCGTAVVLDWYEVARYWSNSDSTCIPEAETIGFAIGEIHSLTPIVFNVPAELSAGIEAFVGQGHVLGDVSFAPDGTFVILGDASEFSPSAGFRPDVLAVMQTLKQDGFEIWNVSFAPNGGWLIVFEGNGRLFDNYPADAVTAVEKMINAGHELWDVIIAPNGSFMVMGAGNFRQFGAGFPPEAELAFEELLARNPGAIADGLRFLPNGAAVAWAHLPNGPVFNASANGVPAKLENALNTMTSKIDCVVISPTSGGPRPGAPGKPPHGEGAHR
jgi:hypothetical protein